MDFKAVTAVTAVLDKLDEVSGKSEKEAIESMSLVDGVGWKAKVLDRIDAADESNDDEKTIESIRAMYPEKFPLLAVEAAAASEKSEFNMSENAEAKGTFQDYRDFMTELWTKLQPFKEIEFGKGEERANNMRCPDDAYNVDPYDTKVVSLQSQMLPIILAPKAGNSFNGMLLYHEVGTGKTRLAMSILKQYKNTHRIIWVTTIKAFQSVRNQIGDIRAFDDKDPGKAIVTGSSLTSHPKGKIALFNYEMFNNSLRGFTTSDKTNFYPDWNEQIPKDHSDSNEYGRSVLLKRYQSKNFGDPFADTIIVVDEAHKVFDEYGHDGHSAFEMIARKSYEVSGSSGRACRWLLLTATPVPDIAISNKKNKKLEAQSGNMFATFKLLNILISDPTRLLPTTKEKFQGFKGENFASLAKGLVSFLRPADWKHIFADVERHGIVKITPEPLQQKAMRSKLNPPGTCKMKNIDDRARCNLRYLHWFGQNIAPKFAPLQERVKIVGGPLPSGKFPKPWGIKTDLTDEYFPRGSALLETINKLDKDDRQHKNKLYKHVIYSSNREAAAAYAEYLTKKGKFFYLNPAQLYDEDALGLRTPSKTSDNYKSNGLLFMHDDLRKADADEVQNVFNGEGFKWDETAKKAVRDPKVNSHGELARIIVLGAGRKEALSLFEVKYIHIMEPQKGDPDTVQVIGRAVRRCGHIGLPPAERKVHVYVYGIDVVHNITGKPVMLQVKNTSGEEKVYMADIVYAILKQGNDLGEKLRTREQIIGWLEATAIEVIDQTDQKSLQGALDEVQTRLKQIDAAPLNEKNIEVDDGIVKTGNELLKTRIKAMQAVLKELGQKPKKLGKNNEELKKHYKDLVQQFKEFGLPLPKDLSAADVAMCKDQLYVGRNVPDTFDPKKCSVADLKRICKEQKLKLGLNRNKKSLTEKCLPIGNGSRNPFVEGFVDVLPAPKPKRVAFTEAPAETTAKTPKTGRQENKEQHKEEPEEPQTPPRVATRKATEQKEEPEEEPEKPLPPLRTQKVPENPPSRTHKVPHKPLPESPKEPAAAPKSPKNPSRTQKVPQKPLNPIQKEAKLMEDIQDLEKQIKQFLEERNLFKGPEEAKKLKDFYERLKAKKIELNLPKFEAIKKQQQRARLIREQLIARQPAGRGGIAAAEDFKRGQLRVRLNKGDKNDDSNFGLEQAGASRGGGTKKKLTVKELKELCKDL